jgi:hypothetical protein
LDGDGDADAMAGGAGNDTYVADNVGDSVTESPGEGSDRVRIATRSEPMSSTCS